MMLMISGGNGGNFPGRNLAQFVVPILSPAAAPFVHRPERRGPDWGTDR